MGSIIKHFPQVLVNQKDQRKIYRKLECDIASLIKKVRFVLFFVEY